MTLLWDRTFLRLKQEHVLSSHDRSIGCRSFSPRPTRLVFKLSRRLQKTSASLSFLLRRTTVFKNFFWQGESLLIASVFWTKLRLTAQYYLSCTSSRLQEIQLSLSVCTLKKPERRNVLFQLIHVPIDPKKSTKMTILFLPGLGRLKVAQNETLFPENVVIFFCSNYHLSYADNGQQKIMWGIWMKYCTRVGSKIGTQTKNRRKTILVFLFKRLKAWWTDA